MNKNGGRARIISLTLLALSIGIIRAVPARAYIVFQNDTVGSFESSSMNLGSDDAGSGNTGIRFGSDLIASENGNITWDIASNTFQFDHSVSVSGGLTASGGINFAAALAFRMPQAAEDPETCLEGQEYYNTATDTVRLCVAEDAWTSTGTAGAQYVFAYDTTVQTVAVSGTFQNVNYSHNAVIDGWSHAAGSADFTATVAGTYMVNLTARVAKSGGSNTTISLRGTLNGTEIAGSQSYGSAIASTGDTLSGNFIINIGVGDILRVQMTGGTSHVQIKPGGHGSALPSTQLSIWRMK